MTRPGLSKPLQVVLFTTVSLTAVALLKPASVEAPDDIFDSLPPARAAELSGATPASGAPWIRLPGEEWKPAMTDAEKAAQAQLAAPPPPPPPAPISLPKPSAPDPGLAYLGRIEQDGHHYVFLGRGAQPLVVEVGGQVDAQWKVEKASATQIELRYLPLGEVRLIAVQ